jgi:hypothetical protein
MFRGRHWVVLSKDGSWVLSRHDTVQEAREWKRERTAERHLHLLAAAGTIRTAIFEEREHVVVPVVALVEGVIFPVNADTPELVLLEEFGKTPQGWDGRPVMPDHPQDDVRRISANDPKTLEEMAFGRVFHSKIDKKRLCMEAWIDPVRAEKVGAEDQLKRIRNGKMIEVSVGCFVVAEEKSGVWNGQKYSAIWREIVPDHLALLPEGTVGACSNEMGCGTPRRAAVHLVTAAGLQPLRSAVFDKAAYMRDYNAARRGEKTSATPKAAPTPNAPAAAPQQVAPPSQKEMVDSANEQIRETFQDERAETGEGPTSIHDIPADRLKEEIDRARQHGDRDVTVKIPSYSEVSFSLPQAKAIYAELTKHKHSHSVYGGRHMARRAWWRNPIRELSNPEGHNQYSGGGGGGKDDKSSGGKGSMKSVEDVHKQTDALVKEGKVDPETAKAYKDDLEEAFEPSAYANMTKDDLLKDINTYAKESDLPVVKGTGKKASQGGSMADKKKDGEEPRAWRDRMPGFQVVRGAAKPKAGEPKAAAVVQVSDLDLRDALSEALRATVPGFLGIDSVFPNEGTVVYASAPGDEVELIRCSYTMDATTGAVALVEGSEVEVEPITTFEVIGADEPTDASARNAAAGGCGCGKTADTSPAGGTVMESNAKTERLKKLLATGKTGFVESDLVVLAKLPDEQIEALERAANPPPKPPTEEEYLANAPASIKAAVEESRARVAARKAELIGQMKAAKQNAYDDKELEALDVPQLEKLVNLIGASAPAKPRAAVDNSGRGLPKPEDLKEGNEDRVPAPPALFEGKSAGEARAATTRRN